MYSFVLTHPPSFSLSSIHPFMPLLVTSSGQRHFQSPGDGDSDSGSDSDEDHNKPEMSSSSDGATLTQDNALTIWWSGPLASIAEGGDGTDRNQPANDN